MKTFSGILLFVAYTFFAAAQQTKPEAADPNSVIRVETNVVLVDAVVTDKKGNYVRDLKQKDFKVWEDNKEQAIKSFSFEADPASPLNNQPRYVVLFFDNSTMNFGDQAQARKAATSFIDANAGPNRQMAIVNYSGSLQITQNFTSDVARLKAIVAGTQIPVGPSPNGGGGGLGRNASSFGQRNFILAIRDLAKDLKSIPGRKTLVLLTAGFRMNMQEQLPDVTATIDMCNRSNVAIYPIDVRGLVAGSAANQQPPAEQSAFRNVSYQGRGGAPTGGGSTGSSGGTSGGGKGGTPSGGTGSTGGSGSSGGSKGGTTGGGTAGTSNVGATNMPTTASRALVPRFPESASTNQQIMYMLADGTGGFVIINTNDLLGGMEKIAKEMNEFYLIGYTPPSAEDGREVCHTIRVKVDKGGAAVRARTGYCTSKMKDVLAQTTTEKSLETRAAAPQAGNVAVTMQAPYFFTGTNVARVNVAMEIPSASLKFEKDKGKLRATINVLGIAYKTDGSVGARFSDAVKVDFDNQKEVEIFQQGTYHYENQFDIASGQYNLKVVCSAGGDNFGKMEQPLVVDPYDIKKFSISALALSTKFEKVGAADQKLETALLEDRAPLIAQGFQVTPTGSAKFKPTDKAAMYFELYEPGLLNAEVPKDLAVAIQIRVLDTKGTVLTDSGVFKIPVPDKGGNPTIPWANQVPIAKLTPGSYKVELLAIDSANNKTGRASTFEIY
jgi:VWFA-related protein